MSGLELLEVGLEIDDRWLVRGASLTLRPGCLTVLAGPNGSGKSTLLRLLTGLWAPNEGKAILDGRDISAFTNRQRARRIAFVPQDTHLDFAFTVRDVVTMGRHPYLGRFERAREYDRRAVDDAMARADIIQLTDRLVTEISGGERQRVIIARSLATEADIILLDEPTANLDIAHSLDILDLCRRLAGEGKMICLAIHDLNAAARCATEVVLLQEGRVVASGAPAEVITDSTVRTIFSVNAERVVTATGEPAFIFHRLTDGNGRGYEDR